MTLGEDRVGELLVEADLVDFDRRLVALKPEDPIVRYNLTCSLSLTFRADDAAGQLREAIRLGYKDFDHMEKDPDLTYLRKQPEYRDILKSVAP